MRAKGWDMSGEQDGQHGEMLTVLRDIWAVTGDDQGELAERLGSAHGKTCKNMARIGFGGLGPTAGSADTNTPIDEDVRAAWRARLERDGKLRPDAVSVTETIRRTDG